MYAYVRVFSCIVLAVAVYTLPVCQRKLINFNQWSEHAGTLSLAGTRTRLYAQIKAKEETFC